MTAGTTLAPAFLPGRGLAERVLGFRVEIGAMSRSGRGIGEYLIRTCVHAYAHVRFDLRMCIHIHMTRREYARPWDVLSFASFA